MLLHELVNRGQDEKIAVIDKGKAVTYAQLREAVARYRSFFTLHGIQKGDNIGLYCKNSAEFIYSYLAIVGIGAVVVPINTMLTPREISYIVRDACIKTVITHQKLKLVDEKGRPEDSTDQLILSDIKEQVDAVALYLSQDEPDDNPHKKCVILYTSGTTGRPKGAVLTDYNLLSNASSFNSMVGFTEEDNFLCVLPMFHSFAWTCCVLTPLLNGGTVTVVENFLPKDVLATIRDNAVNVVCGVPAMYVLYTSVAKPEDFAGVRFCISGGASLPGEVIKAFRSKIGLSIIEGYGLSEASPVVTFNPVDAPREGSIGVDIPEVEVKIVDEQGRELPSGQIGELITKGPNVMKGYHNLPAETAETLRDEWLYTGDLAYRDQDGYIFIVDRKKDMVIVGGLNVYPREIEEVLYRFPAIKEAAVVGVPDKTRGEAVRAFVSLKEGFALDKKGLMKFLREELAVYKLPREIVELEALPKNATGKILKKELKVLK